MHRNMNTLNFSVYILAHEYHHRVHTSTVILHIFGFYISCLFRVWVNGKTFSGKVENQHFYFSINVVEALPPAFHFFSLFMISVYF